MRKRRVRLYRVTVKLGWHKVKHDNWITGRIHHLLLRRAPWWDWGHRVMILVGTCIGGNYDAPEPPTWWYRLGPPKRMRRTGFPRHPLSTYEVINTGQVLNVAQTRVEVDRRIARWRLDPVGR